jgi:molybdate transport system substrate-binding protein
MNRATAIAALAGGYVATGYLRAAEAKGNITVYAAGSLREAFTAANPAFTTKTGMTAALNFAGSDLLATQILNGGPADVFASANVVQMRRVSEAGLTDGLPKVFAENRIVLITPKANPGHVDGLASIARPGVKVVLAERAEPVGTYAREAFKKMAGHGYPSDYAQAIEHNVISNEMNEKDVATKIALGEGDAGVVYSTDIIPQIASQVNVFPFPSDVTPDITYPIVALKNAQDLTAARAFVAFILGDARPFLKARGFLLP